VNLVLDKNMKAKNINESECKWIEDNITALKDLISSIDQSDGSITPESLDKGYATWYGTHEKSQEDPNPMINSFGIGYGSFLVSNLGMQWAIIDRELAVTSQPGDIVVFPANLVAKRYTKGEIDFFSFLYKEMKNTIEQIRINPPAAKPWWKIW
jgi:uncharacterized protein DUF3806